MAKLKKGDWTPAGGGQTYGSRASNPAPVLNNASGSSPAAVAAMIANTPPPVPVTQPDPPKDNKGPQDNNTSPAGPSQADVQRMIQDAIDKALQAERGAEKQRRDAEASSMLRDMFSQWGMSDLVPVIDGLVREFGNSIPVLAEKVRTTDAYKTRFRGLVELQAKGITDVRNEAEYINLESQYRQVFREAGIQSYIGDAGSKPEQSAIADLVGKFSLSVNEVRSRVADAQRVVNDTAPEVKDALQRFYNVAPQDLVAYTLDPQRTMDRINRIANAAMIGGYAQARDLTVDLGTAESLANLSGGNDMNPERLATDLSAARAVRDATRRLASIEDTTLEDSEVVRSQMGVDPEAQRKVRGLQSRERARFSGTSAINAGSLSRNSSV